MHSGIHNLCKEYKLMDDTNVEIIQALGDRDTQEDRYAVRHLSDGALLMAVFDGHNGPEAADACARLLHQPMSPDGWRDSSEASMRTLFSAWNAQTAHLHAGTTASVVYVAPNCSFATVGTIGDSPVLIRRNSNIVDMSQRHNATCDEVGRRHVGRHHGISHADGYIGRRDSSTKLAMTRALGDAWMGETLLRKPEVFTQQLNPKAWILLATDGFTAQGEVPSPDAVGEQIRQDASAEELLGWRAELFGELDDNTTILLWRRPF